MNLQYRLATIQDLPRLSELNSFGTEEGKKEAELELPRFINSNNILVAEKENNIIGLLYWEEKFFSKGRWFLTQITIDENYRRKGIGEMLLKYFFDFAKKQGIKEVYADIRASNNPSVNLVKKLGAIQVGSIDLNDGDPRIFWRFNL